MIKKATIEKKINLVKGDFGKLKSKKKDKNDDSEELSSFNSELNSIKKDINKGNYGEQFDLKVLRSLHKLTLDLIPLAEKNYRKFPLHTAASAVNTYINQSRELMNDIRSLENFTERGNKIIKIIKEHDRMIVRNLIDELYKLKKEIKDSKTISRIDSSLQAFGQYVSESESATSTQIMQLLGGGSSNTNSKGG